jgi:hypothetical protein
MTPRLRINRCARNRRKCEEISLQLSRAPKCPTCGRREVVGECRRCREERQEYRNQVELGGES